MLKVKNVSKSYDNGGLFSGKKQIVLKDISLECQCGECVGIIGESGSGKSTLGRLILGIEKPDSGSVFFEGKPVLDKKARVGKISAVFQDYTSSINPFFTVEKSIIEPLKMKCKDYVYNQKKVDLLLCQVGLNSSYKNRYPHELSGGEAQRVCIARAIATEPKLILLDETTSSLDGCVQVQVLELLKSLRETCKTSYIFITHDIQAAAYICDRVLIVRNGCIEESVEVDQLKNVKSGYTRKLLDVVMA
jgi:nickel transport system ATP-binding protein